MADWPVNAQVVDLVRAGLAEEIERQEREDNDAGPEAEPENTVRSWGRSAARPEDDAARVLLDGWVREYGPMVRRVVARHVRAGDVDLVNDDYERAVDRLASWIGAAA
ncbi:hypothetical protein [Streptomyces niveus]|nr:hypothetical protein [Streptomyces niveus]